MRILIGIDDTDNLESRGTGFRARQLAATLADAGVDIAGVTRHQLLVDPRVPYTSHNSSACLDGACDAQRVAEVGVICRDFLRRESATGSDAGYCIASRDRVDEAIVNFGRRAKVDVVSVREAQLLADSRHLHLEGVTGTGIGVIGALAAVGLRAWSNDGRFLWMPGLRELDGVFTAAWLLARLRLDAIETEAGDALQGDARVHLGEWPRPIMRHGRSVLIVREGRQEDTNAEYDWIVVDRSRIKQLSE